MVGMTLRCHRQMSTFNAEVNEVVGLISSSESDHKKRGILTFLDYAQKNKGFLDVYRKYSPQLQEFLTLWSQVQDDSHNDIHPALLRFFAFIMLQPHSPMNSQVSASARAAPYCR